MSDVLKNKIPGVFKTFVEEPKKYICGKYIIIKFKEQQQKMISKGKTDMPKIMAPSIIDCLLKKNKKEKDEYEAKIEKTIFFNYNSVSKIFEYLCKEKFCCYYIKKNLVKNNLALFVEYYFYNIKNNLLLKIEVVFNIGSKGKICGLILGNKEPIIYHNN